MGVRRGAGANVRGNAGDEAASTGSDLKESAAATTEALRRQAGVFAHEVGDELSRTGEQQKERGADALRHFAGAIDSAASELENQSPAVAHIVHETARRVDGLSSQLANRNVNELIEQAAEFARARPALFIGGSVAAGFALARFLGSSARRGPAQGRPNDPAFD